MSQMNCFVKQTPSTRWWSCLLWDSSHGIQKYDTCLVTGPATYILHGKVPRWFSVVWEMKSGLSKSNSMWHDVLHSRSMNSSPWPGRMALNLILNCAVANLLFLRLTLSRKTVIFSDQKVHLMPTYFLSLTDERNCQSVQWHISIHEKYISTYPESSITPS